MIESGNLLENTDVQARQQKINQNTLSAILVVLWKVKAKMWYLLNIMRSCEHIPTTVEMVMRIMAVKPGNLSSYSLHSNFLGGLAIKPR